MMDHIEPDELAVLALDGDEPDDAVRAHLDGCGECRAEYDALARTVALGRSGVPGRVGAADAGFEAPPSSVWAGIHAELGLAPELAADPLAEEPPEPAPVADIGERRRAWWPVALAAAVGGVLVGVGLGVALAGLGTNDGAPAPEPTPAVLASADLAAFPGWDDATGQATVEEDPDGARSIVVDLDATAPAGDVREVWLIRSDASGLVSLGLLEGSSGRFAIPDGIDLAEYSLVDVSAEPVDGDPAHSGDSIVRGELTET
ncbi:anti-sigma factor domain-containing protein [Agromyces sp. NPDC056523]|uniref:anti-sigma factor n=1 Tax=Agromyces sp. NPDC056523 TaxID=3345850 RepID=UPI00366AE1A7